MTTESTKPHHDQHYQQGDALYHQGKFHKAIREFETALKLVPNDSDTQWAIAGCYSELGKPDLAEKFYRQALENCNSDKQEEIIYNIGNALFDQMKYKEAIAQYKRISTQSVIYRQAKTNINAAQRKIERY